MTRSVAGLAAQRVERSPLQTWSPENRVSSNVAGRSCTGDAAIVGLTGGVVGSGIGYLLGRGWPKRSP